MTPLLEAESISRESGEGSSLLIDVSVSVTSGDRVVVEGSAGSGKTLLLRALSLLDPISDGRILWRGREVTDTEVPLYRCRVAYLPQQPALIEGTVETNLRLPFALTNHASRSFDRSQALQLLETLGKEPGFMLRTTSALSGGERQIVALARQLQLRPSILLLDEPTASLDPETAARAERLIGSWIEDDENRAFVWVSHDIARTEALANRRIRMRQGRLA